MNIRVAGKEDAQELLELFVKLDSETEFMIMTPGERELDVAKQQLVLGQFNSDETKSMIVAEMGHVVGFCVLLGGHQIRNAHCLSLVMGVERSVWGKGVGSELLNTAIKIASDKGAKRIELTVHAENEAGISLYKKHGFVIEGERHKSLKIGDRFVNEYYMGRV